MGVAFYIVLDNDDPGFDAMVNGKAVGKSSDSIDKLCATLGIPPINDFVSMSMDEVADILDEEIPEVQETWFSADEGLSYFGKLVAHLEAQPSVLAKSEAIVADLNDYLTVLRQAKNIGAQWRLSMDM
jgi:hypothetical protein